MDTLKSGSLTISVRATIYARHCYREIFKTEIDEDLNKLFLPEAAGLSFTHRRLLTKLTEEQLNRLAALPESDDKGEALAIFEAAGISSAELISLGMSESDGMQNGIDEMAAMRVIYAMSVADGKFNGAKDIKPFDVWLCVNQEFNVCDCWERFEAEAKSGFFRNKNVRPAADAQ